MPEWSPQQDKALVDVDRWLRNYDGDKQLYRLFGYAGTGKTTLAKHLAADVNGSVLFAAYTGKAASVLRASGAPNAGTLHSLIYTPKGRSKERLSELEIELEQVLQMLHEDRLEGPEDHRPDPDKVDRAERLRGEIKMEQKNSERPDFSLNLDSDLREAALLVVDECSMVDEVMAMDIMSFGTPILVLGDPAQLPPVKGTGYFTDATPDTMLTEIHRQSKDNPIITLATRVREGLGLEHGQYGSSSVIQRATPELALGADQVLVGMNKTRFATNKRMRELKGFTASPFPLAGEKLVCLRNDKEHGLLNGTIHNTTRDSDVNHFVNLRIVPEEYPDAEPLLVPAHKEHFEGDPEEIGYWQRLSAQEFTYGYALTTHKAQGSQWGKVLIIDESGVFKASETRRRWLYTAITRAAEQVTVVRG